MPKQKTHSTSSKKFKVTATGKLRRRSAMSGHMEHQSPKQRRGFRKDQPVSAANTKLVKRLLGRG